MVVHLSNMSQSGLEPRGRTASHTLKGIPLMVTALLLHLPELLTSLKLDSQGGAGTKVVSCGVTDLRSGREITQCSGSTEKSYSSGDCSLPTRKWEQKQHGTLRTLSMELDRLPWSGYGNGLRSSLKTVDF